MFGVALNGRTLTYYIVFVGCAAMILGLLRVVNSPFGRVLQAIRENRFRAEALGYRTVFHRTCANCLAALVAAAAGALNAMWLRYAGPDTSLSFSIMLDILLMVVIGGMGTIYGAIIGAAIFILAQNYLQALMGAASTAAADAGAAAAAGPAPSRPLAAVARPAVHRQRLSSSRPASSALARRRQASTAATEACCRYAHPQSHHAECAPVDAAIPILCIRIYFRASLPFATAMPSSSVTTHFRKASP